MKKLRIFHAVDCNLTSDKIPSSFFTLPSLIELNLSKNQLSTIENIQNLKTLLRLDLSENQLLELPIDIDKIENLENLNLRENNISVLPKNLANLKKLKRILIKDNNLIISSLMQLEKKDCKG